MVLNLDIAPTLLDIAGRGRPTEMQGKSMMPLAEGKPNMSWRKDWLYEYYEYPGFENVRPCRGVRTDRYKFIHFFIEPQEFELYDLHTDPDEMNNLYGKPEYAELTAHLERTTQQPCEPRRMTPTSTSPPASRSTGNSESRPNRASSAQTESELSISRSGILREPTNHSRRYSLTMQHRACTRLFATLTISLVAASLAIAQNNPAPSAAKSDGKPEVKNLPDAPADSTTEGSLKVGGQTIEYRAIAGTLTVGSTDPQDAMIGFDGKYLPDATIDLTAKPEDRPATARFFYAAYFQKNPAKNRPITFLYNGGPGSATMYLHMGAFGPMRLVLPQDSAHQEGAPYQIVPNEYSLLDVSDLVFIDAPGTGFSRIYGKDASKAFYGTDPDAHAFDRFIRRFLSKYDRWNSPEISLRRKLRNHPQRHSHKPASAPPRSQRLHLPLADPQL